jgi:hypothetical protein
MVLCRDPSSSQGYFSSFIPLGNAIGAKLRVKRTEGRDFSKLPTGQAISTEFPGYKVAAISFTSENEKLNCSYLGV